MQFLEGLDFPDVGLGDVELPGHFVRIPWKSSRRRNSLPIQFDIQIVSKELPFDDVEYLLSFAFVSGYSGEMK